MGFITRYGSFWGQIPQTSGRVFWVAPSATYTVEGRSYSASDNNDGLSPERAFLTLDNAIGNCTASVGDVIVLLPGTHTQASTATVDVAGITITGIPQSQGVYSTRMPAGPARNRSIVTAAASTVALTVTAADVEIAYLHFLLVTTAISINVHNSADRCFIHDSTFSSQGVSENTGTIAINVGTGTGTTTLNEDTHIRNCYFRNEGGQGPAVRASGTCMNLIIENSTFQHSGDTAWADAVALAGGESLGTVLRDCDLLVTATGTTVTDFFDASDTATDGAAGIVYRCYVPVGGGAFNVTATADGIVVDSYTAGATGTNTVLATS
jgi:hypothetical protein